eukprot:363517-Chlamydomonas_euryale.AAC.1
MHAPISSAYATTTQHRGGLPGRQPSLPAACRHMQTRSVQVGSATAQPVADQCVAQLAQSQPEARPYSRPSANRAASRKMQLPWHRLGRHSNEAYQQNRD